VTFPIPDQVERFCSSILRSIAPKGPFAGNRSVENCRLEEFLPDRGLLADIRVHQKGVLVDLRVRLCVPGDENVWLDDIVLAQDCTKGFGQQSHGSK